MQVVIPIRDRANPSHRYYDSLFMFYVNLLQYAGCTIGSAPMDVHITKYPLIINNKKILIDFSDHSDVSENNNYSAIFKAHFDTNNPAHTGMYPISPTCFKDWALFDSLKNSISYKACGPILNNQRPYGNALQRRRHVQSILKQRYGSGVDFTITDQLQFYKKAGNCLVSVCVPGATNDILDRGQLEYFGLGACTISPPLITNMPWGITYKPGEHYVSCLPDYSDLVSKIEWCRNNQAACIKIGANAKAAFENSCTPKKQLEWILFKISNA